MALRVVEALAELVQEGAVTALWITGHSLGAALATLLAVDVAANSGFATPAVYTFASPRVGDKFFVRTYDGLVKTSWRIANRNDVVTDFPSRFVGDTHVDRYYPINSGDRCKHNFRCWHSLETYLHTLDSRVPLKPQCVPRAKP